MFVCLYVFIYGSLYLFICVSMFLCIYLCLFIYLCIFVCIYVYLTNCNASWPSGTRAKLAMVSFNIPGVVAKTIEVYGSGILL